MPLSTQQRRISGLCLLCAWMLSTVSRSSPLAPFCFWQRRGTRQRKLRCMDVVRLLSQSKRLKGCQRRIEHNTMVEDPQASTKKPRTKSKSSLESVTRAGQLSSNGSARGLLATSACSSNVLEIQRLNFLVPSIKLNL